MRFRGRNPSMSRAPLFSISLLLCFLLSTVTVTVTGRLISLSKPDPNDAAAYARWLVSHNSWGVLNTIAADRGGAPFGNVVSFSDGLPGKGAGIPYFYLTALDPTATYAMKDERSSLTISEYPVGTCGETDPENPTCAKLTLTEKLKLIIDQNSKEAEFARSALFAKHPEMKVKLQIIFLPSTSWPKDHNFQVFKLEIVDIFLINWFGGPKPLTVEQYLRWKMQSKLTFSS